MLVWVLFYIVSERGCFFMITETIVSSRRAISVRKLPKLHLKKYLTEQALSSVSGAPSVYAKHTDGTSCDTSKGCNCGSK